MSTPGIAEEITLDSGESEVASITPVKENLKNVTLELVQFNKLHKTQKHIRVFDHKTLYIKEKIGKQARHILLELSLINEKPVLIRDFNVATLVASIAVTIVACIASYIHTKGLINTPDIFMYSGIGILALAAVACFVLTAKSYQNSWVFKSADGNVPVLQIFSNAPNKKVFSKFTKAFANNVELARSNRKKDSNLLPAIVGEHRRLFEKGFISEEQFDQARQNILSGK